MPEDLKLYSHEHLMIQLETAEYKTGYYILQFYAKDGKPSKEQTDTVELFYLYPSGGTLRDSRFNLISYERRYDEWSGFDHPHKRT